MHNTIGAAVIREALAADAPVIEQLYRELVTDANICVLPQQLDLIAEDPNNYVLVLELAGTVLGTALFTICRDVMYRAQPYGVVENVIVSHANRGCGYGRLLMEKIEVLAREHDCTKIMLSSNQARPGAHAFYVRCGYNGSRKRAFVKYRCDFSFPFQANEHP